jgi:hypothetical protein
MLIADASESLHPSDRITNQRDRTALSLSLGGPPVASTGRDPA